MAINSQHNLPVKGFIKSHKRFTVDKIFALKSNIILPIDYIKEHKI